jgi:hypothetical protein
MIPITSHDSMSEQVIASCYAVRFFKKCYDYPVTMQNATLAEYQLEGTKLNPRITGT